MWRSMFLAIGIYCCLLGVEALAIETAVIRPEVKARRPSLAHDVTPPEWAPWSLMGAGAVVVLYSFTLPDRVKNK